MTLLINVQSRTIRLSAIVLLFTFIFSACKKDKDNSGGKPVADRISSIFRVIQRPGITIEPEIYDFEYGDRNNRLERVGVFNPAFDLIRMFVFDYHADGRPREIRQLAPDLTTVQRVIEFNYAGVQITSIGSINFIVSGERVTDINNVRLEYDNNGNVVRTLTNNPLAPNLPVTRSTFSDIRNPISAMFDRMEVALSILEVVKPLTNIDAVNRSILATTEVLNSSGVVVDRISFNTTRASNGFVSSYSRSSSTDDAVYTFEFSYEKRE